jgi:hypothetical protein
MVTSYKTYFLHKMLSFRARTVVEQAADWVSTCDMGEWAIVQIVTIVNLCFR